MEKENFNALVKRALQLAYFLHGDKAIAEEIATRALKKLEVAAQAQDKRLYYTPSGRASSRVARTKVSLGEHHLLQRLIYIESEPFEKREQSPGAKSEFSELHKPHEPSEPSEPSEEDMITYFIKHLVKITLKRNSFYVALGMSRLLHSYSTAETMEIYNLTIQDPERVRDDYYYRSRKARLMAEMKERFGDAVRAVRVNRGEERFESDNLSSRYAPLVKECLAYFTPWTTQCVVPEKFDPVREIVKELTFTHKDPDAEHTIEVNRIHSLIHPDCYLRLVSALKYDSPASRLDIPRFFLSENSQKPPRNRISTNWTDEEVDNIRKRLDDEAARRRGYSAGLLRILVDGTERARIDLGRATQTHFEIDSGAELLEVVATDKRGDVLLATRLLDDRALQEERTVIRLEGGQEITFQFTPAFDSLNEVESATVGIAYRETSPLRAATLGFRQRSLSVRDALSQTAMAGWLKPALTFAVVALLAAGLWFFVLRSEQSLGPPKMANENKQAPAPAPDSQQNPDNSQQAVKDDPQAPQTPKQPDKKEQPTINPTRKEIAKSLPESKRDAVVDPDLQQKSGSPDKVDDPEIATRNVNKKPVFVPLPDVKSIAIEVNGEDRAGKQILDKLTSAFASSQRFTVADRKVSDALLKVTVRNDPSGSSFSVRLANSAGFVIFPVGRESAGRIYNGTPEDVAARVLRDLTTEIERQKSRRKEE